MSELRPDIKEQDVLEFEMLAKKLNLLMVRIHRYLPEANLYANCDSLSLMKGSHHGEGEKSEPLQENEVVSVRVCGLDGGDW